MITYRLPRCVNEPQDTTTDDGAYIKDWLDLANRMLKYLPGYVLYSFNPDFVFTKHGKNGLGVRVVLDRITLSVDAIRTLLDNLP
jgi:hypothetical protein